MNYIVEQIEFRKYAYNNFLSTNAMMLWHELFNLCNEFGWIKWFTTNDERLRQYTAIKRAASLTAARNELIEHGLIEYRKGAKGYSSEYHMVSYEVYANGSVSDEALSVDEDHPVQEEIHDTGNDYKPDENKTDDIEAKETGKMVDRETDSTSIQSDGESSVDINSVDINYADINAGNSDNRRPENDNTSSDSVQNDDTKIYIQKPKNSVCDSDNILTVRNPGKKSGPNIMYSRFIYYNKGGSRYNNVGHNCNYHDNLGGRTAGNGHISYNRMLSEYNHNGSDGRRKQYKEYYRKIRSMNRFNNFEQRECNVDEMENLLIANLG